MRTALAIVTALALLGVTLAILPGADPLYSRMQAGDVANPPPVDAMQVFRPGMRVAEAAIAGTESIAAFYLEDETGSATRHPWGLYSEVRSNHGAGVDAVSVYGRLRNEGAGWGTALHAEPIASGTGTTVGVNVEVSQLGTGRALGMCIQAKNGYGGTPSGLSPNEGILFQSNDGVAFSDVIRDEGASANGLHFAATSSTTRAVFIEGTHAVGIETVAPIRLHAGVPLQLEETAQIVMVYANGRIEFRHGTRVVAYLVVDTTATGGRLN